jgi:hypothetical protein
VALLFTADRTFFSSDILASQRDALLLLGEVARCHLMGFANVKLKIACNQQIPLILPCIFSPHYFLNNYLVLCCLFFNSQQINSLFRY